MPNNYQRRNPGKALCQITPFRYLKWQEEEGEDEKQLHIAGSQTKTKTH
jgi:hypothetical protein